MEAAAPVAPLLTAEPVETAVPAVAAESADQQTLRSAQDDHSLEPAASGEKTQEPLPIAVSGDLKIMPPATGLPQPRSADNGNALGGLLESIPVTEKAPEPAEESALHGD